MISQLKTFGRVAAVTPSNTVDIPSVSTQDGSGNRGCSLYIGVTGDVAVVMRSGDVATFKNVLQGTVLHVDAIRVNATNTTATNILALW